MVSTRAHAIVVNGKIYRNSIITYSSEDFSFFPIITPFTIECHSTTSFNGIIILAPEGFSLPAKFMSAQCPLSVELYTEYLNALANVVPPLNKANDARYTLIHILF